MKHEVGIGSDTRRALPKALIASVRPRQWSKNLIVYLALLFTIDQGWKPTDLEDTLRHLVRITTAFSVFCLASSSVYLVNDVLDIDSDKKHPFKRNRPIASGDLSVMWAIGLAITMSLIGLSVAYVLEPAYATFVSIYISLMLAYSVYLKRLVIIDALLISSGFVIRAVSGAVVLGVTISPWLYICTTLGALFLAFAKRLNEVTLAGEDGPLQRQALQYYTRGFLEQLIAIVAPSTLVSYILYTFTADNLPDNNAMMLTIPFVLYGLFRYLYLVHAQAKGESPEEVLITDKPLIINIVLWLVTVASVLTLAR